MSGLLAGFLGIYIAIRFYTSVDNAILMFSFFQAISSMNTQMYEATRIAHIMQEEPSEEELQEFCKQSAWFLHIDWRVLKEMAECLAVKMFDVQIIPTRKVE